MKKTPALLASMAVLLAAAFVFAGGVPKGKEVLKIDLIEGKKGTVEFPHAKHVAEFKKVGGAEIVCKDCHHTATSDKDVKKCSDCHMKVGETPKKIDDKEAPLLAAMKSDTVDPKSVIFHKTCKDGCHKEMKAEGKKITSCKVCHKK